MIVTSSPIVTTPPTPKDYLLQDVTWTARECTQFVPEDLPHVTQETLGRYCFPIWHNRNELPAEETVVNAPDTILDLWAKNARQWWVDDPLLNSKFLHDIYKKYTVHATPELDYRFAHKERIFNRPFKYEIDCMEKARLKKLEDKNEREINEICSRIKRMEDKAQQQKEEETAIKIVPCKFKPPFWWSEEKKTEEEEQKRVAEAEKSSSPTTAPTRYMWQDPPNYVRATPMEPCERRREFALLGIPFKNEALNWYYERYPPPNIIYRQKRFA